MTIRIGEQNANEALTTAIMLNKNRLPGGTIIVPPLSLYKPSEFKIVHAEKEPLLRREEAKKQLLKSSEQILDDIELYGLIVTNDLYKISRNQEILSKADFSSDFIEFRRRLYKNIEKTGDLIINIVKKMKDEFNATKKNINDKMRTKLRRNKGPSSLVEENFNKLKDRINKGTEETEEYINDAAERIHSMIYYLAPPEIKIDIEGPEPKYFDLDLRSNKRKRARIIKKYNEYLHHRFKEIILERTNKKEELAQKEEDNAINREARRKQREEERIKRKEEEQRVRKELEKKEREEMYMFIKLVNETVVPNEGMIPLMPNPYAEAERIRKRERQKTLIQEIDNKSKDISFAEVDAKSNVDNKKSMFKQKSIMKKKTVKSKK